LVADGARKTDAEQALARLRIEAARIAIELNQAERDLDEARDARAETERQLAEEREQRTRLEREIEELRAATNGQGDAHSVEHPGPKSEHERALGQLMDALRPEGPGAATGAPQAAASGAEGRPHDSEPAEPGAERRGRFRRRKRVFQSRGRSCAVCRATEALSPGQLKAEGWALGAEIDICPGCQAEGWQLPKAGSLPFRRSSSRNPAR
jgi:hypothetical protein